MKFANLAFVVLAVSVIAPETLPPGEFVVRVGDRISRGSVSTLTVLPGATITLEATPGSEARGNHLAPLGPGRWSWTAPAEPGFYPIQVVSAEQQDSVTVQALVLVPSRRVKDGYINGYRIGSYPRATPAGFVEVTRANENTLVSPHFRLKQFICKQSGAYPKYIVLDERLLERLEAMLELANESGFIASTFHVMSGYRTPAYNRALGNVPNSRHTWGAAADIFIDENGDGRMDDLNRDGRSDVRDAAVLSRLFDPLQAAGGLGTYHPTAAHGPFVHVDIRSRRARW